VEDGVRAGSVWSELNHQKYRGGVCDRRHAMALAFINGGYRMNEIAKCVGVHYTTVSRAVKNTGEKLHDRKT